MKIIKAVILSLFFCISSVYATPTSAEVEKSIKAGVENVLDWNYELVSPFVTVSFTTNVFYGITNMVEYIISSEDPYITRQTWIYISDKRTTDVYSYHCNVDFSDYSLVVYNCSLYMNGYPCTFEATHCSSRPLHEYSDIADNELIYAKML